MDSAQQQAQAAFDRLYSRVAQRLEQNEALLDGLVALLRAVPDPDFGHLRRYCTDILRRHPHIHTIGYQVRVEHAQRPAFEGRMTALLGRDCAIRDFAIDGERTWRAAPPRAFYYPAAFMAPEVADAQDVIGYDGYGDVLFRAAIDRAGSDDRGVATLPFDLIEGGRGHVFLRAFDIDGPATGQAAMPAAGQAAVPATGPGAHIVSLLVRADHLIDGEAVHPGLDELSTSIAHELNQPLAAVVGYSQAALRMLAPSARAAPVRKALQAGIEQALRASDLIRRLRGLVQQRTLRFETLPLRPLIERAIRLERAQIDGAGISLETRWPDATAEVRGDAVLLAQLFGNLLRNAVQAIEATAQRPACIAIEVAPGNRQWRIEVADSGPGLTAAQRGRAFQPVASTKPQGLGVGLTVCATIAEAHGGTISMEDGPSASGLRGARFVVMLPRAASAASAASEGRTPHRR